MSAEVALGIALFFLAAEQGLSLWLDNRNRKASKASIPVLLAGIYDASDYLRQQSYFREKGRLSTTRELLLFLGMFILFATGLLGRYYDLLWGFFSPLVVFLLFFATLAVVSAWIDLPFRIKSVFGIEARYGFNKTTPRLFVADLFKEGVLSAVVGALLLTLLYVLYQWLGASFWIAAFGVFTLFAFGINFCYLSWILPLFNKLSPLEAGELRTSIETFAQENGFSITDISVMDGSKRSTKANAFFSGMGRKKRIVLYDTLLRELSEEEIVAVLAHEMGHYKHKHLFSMLFFSIAQLFLFFFLFSLLSGSVVPATALGSQSGEPVLALSLLFFAVVYAPLNFLTGWLGNWISRRHEYQADGFAAAHGLGAPLIESLKKLSKSSLSNLTPDSFYVKVYYSHPTLLQRMQGIKEGENVK